MSILPGATVDTPFYRYRATGTEICEKCLYLDLACFPAEEAAKIESELACSCPHVWDGYVIQNNAAITEHAKMGWTVGLSASEVPCPSLCPSDLLKLIEKKREAERLCQIEWDKIEPLFNGPDRSDIAPDEVVYIHNIKLSEAEPYEEAHKIKTRAQRQVWNYVENLVRDAQRLPHIGEGWVNETRLFHIVESIFQDDEVIHHYRASWLGRLELDVYVVGANIGFEYQGIQHYEPQDHWGGEDALIRTQERDAEKARRCAVHGTRLIEVYYDEDLTEELVCEKLNPPADKPQRPRPRPISADEDISPMDGYFLLDCIAETAEAGTSPNFLISLYEAAEKKRVSPNTKAKICKSLGELFAEAGETEKAIATLRRALEYNPKAPVKRLISKLEKGC